MRRPRRAATARVPLDEPGVGLLLAMIDLHGAPGAGAAPVDRRRSPQRAPRAADRRAR